MDKAKKSSAANKRPTATATNQRQSTSTEERGTGRPTAKKPEAKGNTTSTPSSRPTPGKKPEAKANLTSAPSSRPPTGKKPEPTPNTTSTPSSRPTAKKPEEKANNTTSATPSSRLNLLGAVFGRPSSSTASSNDPKAIAKKGVDASTAVSKEGEAATAAEVERNEESQWVDAEDCNNTTSETVTEKKKEQKREESTEEKHQSSSSFMETEAQARPRSPSEAQIFWKGVRETLSTADEEIASAVRPETPMAKITEVKRDASLLPVPCSTPESLEMQCSRSSSVKNRAVANVLGSIMEVTTAHRI